MAMGTYPDEILVLLLQLMLMGEQLVLVIRIHPYEMLPMPQPLQSMCLTLKLVGVLVMPPL